MTCWNHNFLLYNDVFALSENRVMKRSPLKKKINTTKNGSELLHHPANNLFNWFVILHTITVKIRIVAHNWIFCLLLPPRTNCFVSQMAEAIQWTQIIDKREFNLCSPAVHLTVHNFLMNWARKTWLSRFRSKLKLTSWRWDLAGKL